METHPDTLEIMNRFDEPGLRLSEMDVHSTLRAEIARREDGGLEVPKCLKAESSGFWFIENGWNEDSEWGTCLNPPVGHKNDKGEKVVIPPSDCISGEHIEYWEERIAIARHPVIRARYANLVWEFREKIVGTKPNFQIARLIVDDSLAIAGEHLLDHDPSRCIRLHRALTLALRINDADRVKFAKEAILKERRAGFWHIWRRIYDELLWNRKAGLTDAERDGLLDGIRAEFQAELGKEDPNGMTLECLARWLAGFHRRKDDREEMRLVLKAYGDHILERLESVSGLSAYAQIEDLYSVYQDYGLAYEAGELTLLMEEIGERAKSEMQTFSYTLEYPEEETEEFLNGLAADSIECALQSIAVFFTVDSAEAMEEVEEDRRNPSLLDILKSKNTNERGVSVSHVGPIKDDAEGNVIKTILRRIQWSIKLLHLALERTISAHGLTAERLADHLFESLLFQDSRKGLIVRGLRAYLEGDYAASVHLLLPQIEEAVRMMARHSKVSILKSHRDGEFQYKNLSDLLHEETIQGILGTQFATYLAALLIDKRGWNIRNRIAHGIINYDNCGKSIGDRTTHALLILALFKQRPAPTSEL